MMTAFVIRLPPPRMYFWLSVHCFFTSTETVGLLGTGAQDVHLDFHTAPELCVDDTLCSPFTWLSTDRMFTSGQFKGRRFDSYFDPQRENGVLYGDGFRVQELCESRGGSVAIGI